MWVFSYIAVEKQSCLSHKTIPCTCSVNTQLHICLAYCICKPRHFCTKPQWERGNYLQNCIHLFLPKNSPKSLPTSGAMFLRLCAKTCTHYMTIGITTAVCQCHRKSLSLCVHLKIWILHVFPKQGSIITVLVAQIRQISEIQRFKQVWHFTKQEAAVTYTPQLMHFTRNCKSLQQNMTPLIPSCLI